MYYAELSEVCTLSGMIYQMQKWENIKVYVCGGCMHGMYRGRRSNYSPPSSDHQPHPPSPDTPKGCQGWRTLCNYFQNFCCQKEWFWWQPTPLQSIENSLFIHASSAEQSLVKPPAMYHLQIVAPLMPLVHCRCAPYATNPPILVQLRWFQGIPGQCPSLLSTPHRGS